MPAMVRKAHQKSRQGCMCCKRRHVKCSETRPRCQHCTRLGIECTWPEGSKSTNAAASSAQSQSQSPAAATPHFQAHSPGPLLRASQTDPSSISRPTVQPELSIDDLKLLHFYLFNTSASITTQDSQYVWQSVVVELGFRHHFLLHGILAVAATHKAGIFTSEQEELLVQSASHLEVGLSTFRKCLESPIPAICVPVFLMAGLISVQCLGTAQVHRPVDPLGDICMWMRMTQGTRSTIHENWQFLVCSEIGSILLDHPFDAEDSTNLLEIDDLRSLLEQETAPGSAERAIYLNCAEQLRVVFISDRRLPIDRKRSSALISAWAATVDERYCGLLVQRQPLALIIIAFFSTLFRNHTGIWWYRNWDTWIMNAVQSELPVEYEAWLEWPKAKLDSMSHSPSAGII